MYQLFYAEERIRKKGVSTGLETDTNIRFDKECEFKERGLIISTTLMHSPSLPSFYTLSVKLYVTIMFFYIKRSGFLNFYLSFTRLI